MLYYGDKFREIKILENYYFFIFYPPTSEILIPEKIIVEMEFYFYFLSSDIRYQVKKSVNQKIKKKLPK